MYEDVSYYTTTAEPQVAVNRQPSVRHKRKNSLLEPARVSPVTQRGPREFVSDVLQEGAQANVGSIDVGKTLVEEEEAVNPLLEGPPKATLSRRAQSYADFHHAVEAVLGSRAEGGTGKAKTEDDKWIQNDLDVEDWYDEVEDGLLEASHDRYKYYLVSSDLLEVKSEPCSIGITCANWSSPSLFLHPCSQIPPQRSTF